jgi:hypothetical protein
VVCNTDWSIGVRMSLYGLFITLADPVFRSLPMLIPNSQLIVRQIEMLQECSTPLWVQLGTSTDSSLTLAPVMAVRLYF